MSHSGDDAGCGVTVGGTRDDFNGHDGDDVKGDGQGNVRLVGGTKSLDDPTRNVLQLNCGGGEMGWFPRGIFAGFGGTLLHHLSWRGHYASEDDTCVDHKMLLEILTVPRNRGTVSGAGDDTILA